MDHAAVDDGVRRFPFRVQGDPAQDSAHAAWVACVLLVARIKPHGTTEWARTSARRSSRARQADTGEHRDVLPAGYPRAGDVEHVPTCTVPPMLIFHVDDACAARSWAVAHLPHECACCRRRDGAMTWGSRRRTWRGAVRSPADAHGTRAAARGDVQERAARRRVGATVVNALSYNVTTLARQLTKTVADNVARSAVLTAPLDRVDATFVGAAAARQGASPVRLQAAPQSLWPQAPRRCYGQHASAVGAVVGYRNGGGAWREQQRWVAGAVARFWGPQETVQWFQEYVHSIARCLFDSWSRGSCIVYLDCSHLVIDRTHSYVVTNASSMPGSQTLFTSAAHFLMTQTTVMSLYSLPCNTFTHQNIAYDSDTPILHTSAPTRRSRTSLTNCRPRTHLVALCRMYHFAPRIAFLYSSIN
ncbi:hypothetical protein GGX14DRAFT_570675 [Mycena pura]|uniref:Uncharacterized protein n=1 Tax=Mycena pura TaxID=153505 RepID=A0AAD6V4I4_9AGAR|nr:hypothetical protein GGX14DRAFT_580957 [Mycena pura]KAJ7202568.1 hypothetical protein GGX14DRAFT_570675 [Mycena pura]